MRSDEIWKLLGVRPAPGHMVPSETELTIETPFSRIPCTALIPQTPKATILYAHAHGLRYDIGGREAAEGRSSLQSPPLGQALYAAGFAVIAPDMPGHGRRQVEGPEDALAKAAHWHGETLFGHMIRDLCACLDVLPELRLTGPIGTVGFSMGSFLSLFLAALRPDVQACAHLCGVTSMRGLVEAGQHNLHAPYLTIPGLLKHADLPDIAASIAPRAQFVGAGRDDPLTPPATLDPMLALLNATYPPHQLTTVVEHRSGHVETPRMRQALLAFFEGHLSAPDGDGLAI